MLAEGKKAGRAEDTRLEEVASAPGGMVTQASSLSGRVTLGQMPRMCNARQLKKRQKDVGSKWSMQDSRAEE